MNDRSGDARRDPLASGPAAFPMALPGVALGLLVCHGVLVSAWPRLWPVDPGETWSWYERHGIALNLALYAAHLMLAASVLRRGARLGARRLVSIAIGYGAILWLLWPLIRLLPENLLTHALAVLVYAGLLHRPRLLGYLYLFLLCQRFLGAYLYAAFPLGCVLYTTLAPFARAWRREREWFMPLCHVAGLMLLTCLLLPILYFCTRRSSQDVLRRLQEADVQSALGTSLWTSLLATIVVLLFGVPMAYVIVRRGFPGRGLVDTLIDLPIVVPPPIAGIALLALLGPKAPLGSWLGERFGIGFFDSFAGVVAAQVFVASPYLIRASMVAFGAIDERIEHVARTLGASSASAFFRVTLPLALRGILIGTLLTWFRAMAEFGALRIIANRPRTIPILTYERFIEYRQAESQSVAVLILLLCLGVIAGMWIVRTMPAIVGAGRGRGPSQ